MLAIRFWRWALAIFIVQLHLAVGGYAQEPPRVTSTTELVLVPVVVQRSGHSVTDLKQDDFKLFQDGVEQRIAVFEAVHNASAAPFPGPGEFGNVGLASRPQTTTVIAIDTVNTPVLDQAYLRQELIKFLEQSSTTQDPILLVEITISGIRVVHEFSTDPRSVAATIKKLKSVHPLREGKIATNADVHPCEKEQCFDGTVADDEPGKQPQPSGAEAVLTTAEVLQRYQSRNERLDTLYAFYQLVERLRGVPGKKVLVWASSGFKIFDGFYRTGASKGWGQVNAGDAEDQYKTLFRVLNEANISVYPVDARHGANASFADFDVTFVGAPSGPAKERTRQADMEIVGNFQQFAASTGGKPCFWRTDLHNCMREAVDDARDYYMLGYYLDKKTAPGWHVLSVKTEQKAELRYRTGFVSGARSGASKASNGIQLALASPLPYTAIAFRGRIEKVEGAGDKRILRFSIDIPAGEIRTNENRLAFDVVSRARREGGDEAVREAKHVERNLTDEEKETVEREGIHYSGRLEVATGDYGIWFVVRDNTTGHTGSAISVLKVK